MARGKNAKSGGGQRWEEGGMGEREVQGLRWCVWVMDLGLDSSNGVVDGSVGVVESSRVGRNEGEHVGQSVSSRYGRGEVMVDLTHPSLMPSCPHPPWAKRASAPALVELRLARLLPPRLPMAWPKRVGLPQALQISSSSPIPT